LKTLPDIGLKSGLISNPLFLKINHLTQFQIYGDHLPQMDAKVTLAALFFMHIISQHGLIAATTGLGANIRWCWSGKSKRDS